MEKFDSAELFKVLQDGRTKDIEKRAEREKKMEGMKMLQKEFPKEELRQILELGQLLRGVEKKILDLDPDQTEKVYENLAKTQEVMDELAIWDTKFTTGDIGKYARTDSVYYTTPSGIALRFKMRNVQGKPGSVIQPFMENITFEDYSRGDIEEYPEQMPAIGLHPQEYLSKEFYDFQKHSSIGNGFISKTKLYFEGDKLYYVKRPENLYHEHNGSPVNKVIFIR